MELFHGGCYGCTAQDKEGVAYCTGCQFFDTNWKLPNLNSENLIKKNRLRELKTKAMEEAERLNNPTEKEYKLRIDKTPNHLLETELNICIEKEWYELAEYIKNILDNNKEEKC